MWCRLCRQNVDTPYAVASGGPLGRDGFPWEAFAGGDGDAFGKSDGIRMKYFPAHLLFRRPELSSVFIGVYLRFNSSRAT